MMKALLAAALLALSIGQAGAVCLSHSPYDPRCSVQDMLDPTAADPQFYMQNPIVRQTRIWQCTAPVWPQVTGRLRVGVRRRSRHSASSVARSMGGHP